MNWHGWKFNKNDIALHVGILPKNKRPSLYFAKTTKFCCQITPLATFKNEASAKEFLRYLDNIFDKEKDPNGKTTTL